MLQPPFERCWVLTGPTGSGKTELGVQLAEQLGAEIVSMDSMTLYRGMDIGTAKPARALRRRVPHHLVDVLDPWESASVAWWLQEAARLVGQIEERGKGALFVGGTSLYLKALLRGLFEGPAADLALRRRLTREAENLGPERLHQRLAQVDPVAASRLHPNDVRRIIRALEVWELTGRPISRWQTQWQQPAGPAKPDLSAADLAFDTADGDRQPVPSILWLDVPRAELYARIDVRVKDMLAAGFVDEVRALLCLPRPLSQEAAQAVGYREMLQHVQGSISLDEAVVRIQTRSRRLAKRQLTWFRSLPECRPARRELTFAAWGLTMGG
jgi:tRNA dimethylallyltransferase